MKTVSKKCFLITASLWLGCFALLAGFYVLLIWPQQKSIQDHAKEIAQQDKYVQQLHFQGSDQVRTEIQSELDELHNTLADYLMDSAETSRLTFNVNKIARNIKDIQLDSFASKQLSEISDATLERCQHINEQRINVNFSSNFVGFAQFLNQLERNRPMVYVDEFHIERDANSEVNKVEMELATFVKTPPPTESDDTIK